MKRKTNYNQNEHKKKNTHEIIKNKQKNHT